MDGQYNKTISLTEIIRIIKRRKWLLFICIVGSLVPVLIYNYKTIPDYRASTKLIFEDTDKSMEFTPLGSFKRESFIANQIEEMKTKSFAEDVYKELAEDIKESFLKLSNYKSHDPESFIIWQIQGNLSFTPINGT